MDYEVFLSTYALRDLDLAVNSRMSIDSAKAAKAYANELLDKLSALCVDPKRGRVVPELREPELREVLLRSWRIVYRINQAEACVEIVRFVPDEKRLDVPEPPEIPAS
jgi:plasmid stabilization system protein ParE